MSRKCLPNWISTYLKYTAYQQAPKLFHTWAALSTLASALQRRVYMDRGYYTLFPNLYVAIVGPTGVTKSTSSDIATYNILSKLKQIDLVTGKATSWALYDLFGKKSGSGQECCVTIYTDEMRQFMADIDKAEMVALLTALYNCPADRQFRTKTGGVLSLKNVCINILSCSTPEWLVTGTSYEDIHGGFTGRFVYVYQDIDERSFAFPEDFVTPDIKRLETDLVDDLNHISKLQGQFLITDQAKAEYILWYNDRKKEWTDERLVGYYARKGDLVLKLSMLLTVARGDILVIDEKSLHLAWNMLSSLENQMGKAFAGVVEDPAMRHKDSVVAFIARSPNQQASRSEILRKFWNKLNVESLDRIVANLIESGVISMERIQAVNGKGVYMYKLIDKSFS